MVTRTETRETRLYEQDVYAWATAQAALLRARRFTDLDLEHLIEEVEDVAGALKRSARQRVRTILEHLLKLEHSPAQEPRPGWRATVRTQRVRLRDALTPSLRGEVENELAELYGDARGLAEGALRDHREDAAAGALPVSCPYSLDQVLADWLPE